MARRGLCPGCKHCSPAVPRQASRRHFRIILLCSTRYLLVPFCTPTQANFLALMAPEGSWISKANFQKIFGVHDTPELPSLDGAPHPAPPQHDAFVPCAGCKYPIAGSLGPGPLRSYGAPLVPQQEQCSCAAIGRIYYWATWDVPPYSELRKISHMATNATLEKFQHILHVSVCREITTLILLLLKCTKFDFGWGSAQTLLGELTALPKPPSWI